MKKIIAYALVILIAMSACKKEDVANNVIQKATKVELNITSKDIKVDDKPFTLKVTTTPINLEIMGVWSSSNSSIASVDDKGLVTPVSVGTANIKFTLSENVFAHCEVNVLEPIIEAGGVSLSDENVSIVNGETFQLNATIDSDKVTDKTLTWKSYNEDVATVDNYGEITAVGIGSAIIVVETANRHRATCNVTVVHPAFAINPNMIGTWTGVKMELIRLSDGKVFDENTMGDEFHLYEDFYESQRTRYSYELAKDGSMKMFVPLKGYKTGFIKGDISDGGYEDVYVGDFIVNRLQVVGETEIEEISGDNNLSKQTIVFKDELVEIRLPYISGIDMKVYYKVTK